jgi:conjugative transfer signal peptidase TraF
MTVIGPRSALLITLSGLAALCLGVLVKPNYRLLYNASDSAPRGWYALVPERDFRMGTLVFARLPSRAATLAAERDYLPLTVPILKHIAATRGHLVCAHAGVITIDGVVVGRALARDGAGRRLEHWMDCRALKDDELFLLGGDNPASFDSRYFGPVNVAAIVGTAIPLWTW